MSCVHAREKKVLLEEKRSQVERWAFRQFRAKGGTEKQGRYRQEEKMLLVVAVKSELGVRDEVAIDVVEIEG